MKGIFCIALLFVLCTSGDDSHVSAFSPPNGGFSSKQKGTNLHANPSWEDLSSMPNFENAQPLAVNGASYSSRPSTSEQGKPTLYRERHGWCPYSERIWLALEVKKVDYDTVYIDNIYGRPSWYRGDTPQIMWEDGKVQSESIDLLREVDKRFNGPIQLYPDEISNEVVNKVRAFDTIFPRGARPSSRAAFLFRYDGEPLWKNEFEKVLRETNELLAETAEEGTFFCGERITAADVAWAPFLERYAGQLPCLHDDLNPRCETAYPHLARWYQGMEQTIPEYACRVRGDASSWRKVLCMAGFGNVGNVPSLVSSRIEENNVKDTAPLSNEEREEQQRLWDEYASSRPYVAASPGREAASVLIRNRDMIVKDIEKIVQTKSNKFELPAGKDLDATMRSLACILCEERYDENCLEECQSDKHVQQLAAFLDFRMSVPRDMNALSAAYFKRLAVAL